MTTPATPTATSGLGSLGAMLRLPHAAGLALSVFLLGFGLSLAVPYLTLYAVNRAGMTPCSSGC